jgi:hypothetical protein
MSGKDRISLTMTGAVAVLLTALLVSLLGGCSGAQARITMTGTALRPLRPALTASAAPRSRLRARSVAGPLRVWATASVTSRPFTTLPAIAALGDARPLLVLAVRGGWVRVALPGRPNGATGWAHRADVVLEPMGVVA